MTFRAFAAAALAVCAAFLLFAGEAAAAGGRIALLISLEEGPFKETVAGFHEYLSKQGAQTTYELISLEGNGAKVGPALQKIKQGKFDLILTLGALATDAAVREITDTPIVAGLILRDDVLKKAANASGVTLEFPLETQLAWVRKMLPLAHTVGVVYNPRENGKRIEAAARIAKKHGLKLERQEVSSPQDVPEALERLSQKADVLWGLADTLVLTPQLARPILLFSFRNRIPLVAPSATWVKAGALYSLDYDYREIGEQCGKIAFKIMNGEAPAAVPPEAPQTVRYSLNMSTARQMKLSIPDELVRGALRTY